MEQGVVQEALQQRMASSTRCPTSFNSVAKLSLVTRLRTLFFPRCGGGAVFGAPFEAVQGEAQRCRGG
jgi:hypothetical protein